jgi:signal transduction histidine kinase
LIGHFQISHSGELLTPFYPDTSTGIGKSMWDNFSFDDQEQRKKTRDLIQLLLKQLDIKNGLPKRTVQTVDSTEAIDQLYDEIPDLQIPTRVELTSEEEALTYMAETAKNDTSVTPDIPIFNGSNTNVSITDLKIRMTSDYIVFFRTIYIGMLPIVQGFVVDKSIYLNYMTQEERIAYAELPYAIELVSDDKVLLALGKNNATYTIKTSRPLPPPYEKILFKMYASPAANTTGFTVLFSGIVMLIVIAVCLVTIYRFTQSKVALASKRQDFVSAITHELKTPLTAIKMYAELLQNSWVANEEKKQRYYGQIASEADRLSRLIQNVLNLSKLDGNRWNVQLRKERPKAVLDDFVATYSRNIEKQGFELTVSTDTDADNITVLIDRDAVMQILMNLVDNSLKFSKNASYKMVNIELRVNGGDLYLAVRDYGPGIPAAEMKKVFQEFYRVENEMTRSTSGTGIGLSMVKKLCTLTNMKIEIENANPGLRTKIHFPSLDI